MKRLSLAGLFLLALLLLGSQTSGADPKGKVKAKVKKAVDVVLIKELREVKHLLSKANHNYKGHRAKGVQEIGQAIKHLEKEAHVQGHKVPSAYNGPEPQPVSDAQLKKAIADINAVLKQLGSVEATPQRTKAAAHLRAAIKELEIALTIA